MSRKNNKRVANILNSTRGQAGLERAETLAQGGNAALIWRSGGVKAGYTVDRRKRADKSACRGRVDMSRG